MFGNFHSRLRIFCSKQHKIFFYEEPGKILEYWVFSYTNTCSYFEDQKFVDKSLTNYFIFVWYFSGNWWRASISPNRRATEGTRVARHPNQRARFDYSLFCHFCSIIIFCQFFFLPCTATDAKLLLIIFFFALLLS